MRRRASLSGARRLAAPALAITALIALFAAVTSPGGAAVPRQSGRTRLVLLGTGTPNAEPDRSGSAVAVIVDDVPYVVDAGPGVVRQASAAAGMGIEALQASRLRRLFLTHLHSDHTTGLPDFIFTPWVLERPEPLEVYGPPGTRSMIDHLLQAYQQDIRVRIEGREPANEQGYRVTVHEIAAGPIYRDDRVSVTAFPVEHGAWEYAFGFRFETVDGVIVVSGDTVPIESVVAACDGCDILVHEVYSDAGFAKRQPVWQEYHSRSHTSATELAGIASRARPGLLVLYHQLLWGSTPEELVAEVRQAYQGRVVYGNDLDVFALPLPEPPGRK
jgi:ribonuclease BN (tRNA processing enzyme)